MMLSTSHTGLTAVQLTTERRQQRFRRCTSKYRAIARFRESPKADVVGLSGLPQSLKGQGGRIHRPRGSRQSVTLRRRCRWIKSCRTLEIAAFASDCWFSYCLCVSRVFLVSLFASQRGCCNRQWPSVRAPKLPRFPLPASFLPPPTLHAH